MKIALLVNRDNFEAYAPPVPGDWDIVYMGNGEPDAAAVIATKADVLIVDAIMKIGGKIIEAIPGLKLIHSQGVGFAGIDLEAADRAGVYVCNNAGANAKSVAEHTLLLALALLKKFRSYEDMVYTGRQMEAKTECFAHGLPELSSRKVGIVGMGAIGRASAALFAAFGCEVRYFSRTEKPDCGHQYLPLKALYASSDILSLHCPVTPETTGMIGSRALSQMKDGAILINTARGELVDHLAVAEALKSGKLSGFGADTLAPEPVLSDNPFLNALPQALRARVALSPHVAGITANCFIRGYQSIFRNIEAVQRGARPGCIVNGV